MGRIASMLSIVSPRTVLRMAIFEEKYAAGALALEDLSALREFLEDHTCANCTTRVVDGIYCAECRQWYEEQRAMWRQEREERLSYAEYTYDKWEWDSCYSLDDEALEEKLAASDLDELQRAYVRDLRRVPMPV